MSAALENHLTELAMGALAPRDVGEVAHDLEVVEIEMECDVHEDAPARSPTDEFPVRWFDELWFHTTKPAVGGRASYPAVARSSAS